MRDEDERVLFESACLLMIRLARAAAEVATLWSMLQNIATKVFCTVTWLVLAGLAGLLVFC